MDRTPALARTPVPRDDTADWNEAYTIIRVVRDSPPGSSYWMLLDYGTGAVHEIDWHYTYDETDAFSWCPGHADGFTHTARSGHDGETIYANNLAFLVEHMNRKATVEM